MSEFVNKSTITGKFIGEGSYGQIISNPRLPFDNEKIINLINLDEVSKIFIDNDEYNYEVKSYTENNFLNELKDFIVLPIKYGKINYDEFNNYDIEYINDYNNKVQIIKSFHINHITFPKGNSIFKSLKSNNDFIFKLDNVIKCVIYFYYNNLFFPDLKFVNSIEIDDQYKLIDIASIIQIDKEDIKNTLDKLFNEENGLFYDNYFYSPHSLIPILYLRYINCILISNDFSSIKNIIYPINSNEFYKFIFLEKSKNIKSYIQNIKYIEKIFNFDKMYNCALNFEIVLINIKNNKNVNLIITDSNIYKILNELYYERLGCIYLDNDLKNNEKYITNYLELYNKYINYIILNNTNNTNNNEIDFKNIIKYLLDKIQLYSFGIFILEFIKKYYNNCSFDENYCNLLKLVLMSCISIIKYDNNYLVNNYSITDVKNDYDKIINKLNSSLKKRKDLI